MIGIVQYLGSTDTGNCVDRKRRRLSDSEVMIDFVKVNDCPSTPPKWHKSLKQHLNNFTTHESKKKKVSLDDITPLLIDSGFVGIADVYHLSQTCQALRHTTIRRSSTWKALCMQEFPSGTKQISRNIIEERGYKWLYREWKTSMQSTDARHKKRAKIYMPPLPPPRLVTDQIIFLIHLNGHGDRPLHKIPISMSGSDLSPLLQTGEMTLDFPESVLVPRTNGHLHVRIHFLSIADASMCCIYNEAKTLSLQLRTSVVNHLTSDEPIDSTIGLDTAAGASELKYDTCKGTANIKSSEREYIEFGPTNIESYHNCDLLLSNSPAANDIKQRLPCNTTLVLRAGLCLAMEGEDSNSNQSNPTDINSFVPITGIRIEVLKYDRTKNTCLLFDSDQMQDHNGGVTILHYLSELQLS